jgi:hypothetical protein
MRKVAAAAAAGACLQLGRLQHLELVCAVWAARQHAAASAVGCLWLIRVPKLHLQLLALLLQPWFGKLPALG